MGQEYPAPVCTVRHVTSCVQQYALAVGRTHVARCSAVQECTPEDEVQLLHSFAQQARLYDRLIFQCQTEQGSQQVSDAVKLQCIAGCGVAQ